MTMKEKVRIHVEIERENRRKLEEWKPLTVSNAIHKFPDDSIISIATKEYGVFWIGRAKFAFSHIGCDTMKESAEIVGQRIVIG